MEQNEPKPECGAKVCHECALKRDGDCIGPTTGEIVENLRGMLSQFERMDYAELVGAGSVFCGHRSVWSDPDAYKIELAINRLESQEQTIAALTARAEQAERERDAAVNALTLYEDALFDECDKSYQSGFIDGLQSREEIDDED